MNWEDEGYLLSKNNFDENSIIVETFTINHGKCTGIVYGGSSRKNKRIFQIGNKIFLNYKSKNENKTGYFNVELIKPISPLFFDNKKKSICLLSAASILKILLPERQVNEKIYHSFTLFLNNLLKDNWIKFYIQWELNLIKELGFETDLKLKSPEIFNKINSDNLSLSDIKNGLIFNKKLLFDNFILPNKLKLPLSRNILEKYYQ